MVYSTDPLGNLLFDKGYIRGPFGSALKRGELKTTGTPVYEQQHAIDGVRTFRFYVDETKYNELKRFSVKPNDLIISCSGTVGRVSVIEEGDPQGIISQALLILRPNPEVLLPRFLYYFLISRQGQAELLKASHGAVQQNIAPRTVVEKIQTPLPDLYTQHHIVALLQSFDERISLLRETNATLEAIAQALFKSWFVDFDPVHAKLHGRAPEGMDEATAALFPDSFEESKLGFVPRGWRVGTLASLAALNPESWTAKKHPDTLAYIDLANAKNNEIVSVTDYLFEEAPSRARRVLRDSDTIIGTVRPGNRSFAFIHEPAENLTASTGFAVLRPSMIQNAEFVYLAATQNSSIEYLAHVADGGAYPAVRPEVVIGIQSVLPCHEVMQAFHNVIASLLSSIAENQQYAQTLANLRDTLLPRLTSGQLRLPETDNQFK